MCPHSHPHQLREAELLAGPAGEIGQHPPLGEYADRQSPAAAAALLGPSVDGRSFRAGVERTEPMDVANRAV